MAEFEEATVRSCPRRTDSALGEVYAVPVRAVVGQSIQRQVEEEIVAKEHALREKQNKKRKRDDAADDLDVPDLPAQAPPAAPAASGRGQPRTEEEAARDAAKAAATAKRRNDAQNKVATKSVASLTSVSGALVHVTQEVQKHCWDVEPDFMKTLQEAQAQMSAWLKETTDYMHLYETAQNCEVELKALSYSAQDLKSHTKAAHEVLAEARDMVKSAKKAKKHDTQTAKAKAKAKPRAKARAQKEPEDVE